MRCATCRRGQYIEIMKKIPRRCSLRREAIGALASVSLSRAAGAFETEVPAAFDSDPQLCPLHAALLNTGRL